MQQKIVLENGTISVYETSTGEKIVYGSELYKGLGITFSYLEWLNSRLRECKAVEDEDFCSFIKRSDSPNGCPEQEHMIKLNVAKRIIEKENDGKGGTENETD
nr:antA/AntB antirepressor family protein [uncultured Merdimonas sp.]